MGQPRRRFPGGSVGKFFVARPLGENGDPPDVDCFLTEAEALKVAQRWADSRGERIYIAVYTNHVDPQGDNDA